MMQFLPKVLELLFNPLGIAVAGIAGVFLFWRASRYELVDSQDIFDVVLLFAVGALLFGRVGDFFVRYDFYKWSFSRLFFFNTFGGFDYYFAFLGGALSVWLYLKNRREDFWFVFDLAAPPLVYSLSLYAMFSYLFVSLEAKSFVLNFEKLFFAIYYLVVFWVLKRLEKRKRHRGFFACFAILATFVAGTFAFFRFPNPDHFYGVPYQFVANAAIFVFVVPAWYLLSKRKIWQDVKAFFALVLLSLFKAKRVIFSVWEANNLAKAILLSPYLLVKGVYFLVKLLGREIAGGFFDFVHALGIGK